MGFDLNTVELLLMAKCQGVDFVQTATLGRQAYYGVGAQDLQRSFRFWAQTDLPLTRATELLTGANGFADVFLRELGAGEVVSIDASAYEGATHVHDMNQPLPSSWRGQFTTVIDGGTLEHIYNFPTAFRNCLEMVAVGGHFLTITPVNNLPGHGFYQFSPELFFRSLDEANGFVLERMILFESVNHAAWYQVDDPLRVGARVEFVNSRPACLYVQARKTANQELFRKSPQQADYAQAWSAGDRQLAHRRARQSPALVQQVKRLVPTPVKSALVRTLFRFRRPGLHKLDRSQLRH